MARRKAKKATKKSSKKSSKKMGRKKAVKRTSRKAASRKTKKTAKKAAPRRTKAASRKTTAKRATRKKNGGSRNIPGEGNYTASRNFRSEQEGFVRKNKRRIPEMGKEAEAALEGPQGGELRSAEDSARERGEGMDRPPV
jgi:hypothetical protein